MSSSMDEQQRGAWARSCREPEAFAEEQACFQPIWTLLCLSTDIPNDNDWVRCSLGGRSVFVQRFGATIRGFENICRHRFYPIRTRAKGSGLVRCGFHHWVYNQEGQAVGIPQCKKLFGVTPRELDARLEEIEIASCGFLIFGRFRRSKGPTASPSAHGAADPAAAPLTDPTDPAADPLADQADPLADPTDPTAAPPACTASAASPESSSGSGSAASSSPHSGSGAGESPPESPQDSSQESLQEYLAEAWPILEAICQGSRGPHTACSAVKANWKLLYELTLEEYHLFAVHPATFRMLFSVDPAHFGKAGYLKPEHAHYPRFGRHSGFFFKGKPGDLQAMAEGCQAGTYRPGGYRILQIFPNLLVNHYQVLQSWYVSITQYVPKGHDRTMVRSWFFQAPFPCADSSLLQRVVRLLTEPWLPFFVGPNLRRLTGEDHAICETLQPIAERNTAPPLLGGEEQRIAWFREAYVAVRTVHTVNDVPER